MKVADMMVKITADASGATAALKEAGVAQRAYADFRMWVNTEPMMFSEMNAEDRHALRYIHHDYPLMSIGLLNLDAIAGFFGRDRHLYPVEQHWVQRKRKQRAAKRAKRAIGRNRW